MQNAKRYATYTRKEDGQIVLVTVYERSDGWLVSAIRRNGRVELEFGN